MNQKIVMSAVSFVLTLASASALAETSSESVTGTKFLTGLTMGAGSYNNDFGTKMAWGLEAAARLNPAVEVGMGYRSSKLESGVAFGVPMNISVDYLMGTGSYRLPAGKGAFFGGIQAGVAKIALNADLGIVSAELASMNKFAAGPRIGYQLPVSEKIEIGAAADYVKVFGKMDDGSSIHSLGLLASAAYVF